MRIMTEPKNAVLRQFQRFFALDGVELVFTQDALEACADEAILRKTGARGLRTVLEDTLLDVMYEVPSRSDVQKCIVSGETIRNRQRPLLVTSSGQEIAIEDNFERLKGVSA
jgi:ATP-dependent Clp protease ATP-binding subunit ClpX